MYLSNSIICLWRFFFLSINSRVFHFYNYIYFFLSGLSIFYRFYSFSATSSSTYYISPFPHWATITHSSFGFLALISTVARFTLLYIQLMDVSLQYISPTPLSLVPSCIFIPVCCLQYIVAILSKAILLHHSFKLSTPYSIVSYLSACNLLAHIRQDLIKSIIENG
jgi:hypothetical protein